MRRVLLFLSFCIVFIPQLHANELSIERAVDGETVLLTDGRRVRLIGVNTTAIHAALNQRYKLTPDQISQLPLSSISQDAMEYIRLHVVGKNIILSYDPANERRGHVDAEGRILAYVWYTVYSSAPSETEGAGKYLGIISQDRLLNQELITMGYGLADTSAPFMQQESFLDQEKEAADKKRGFWQSAANFYQDLMRKAQESQSTSTAGFVGGEARKLSLTSARASYEKLIQLNPKDYRAYYERSWLGANAVHDQVTEDNLKDIDTAISLSSFQPKLFLQRFYLLHLLGRYEDSQEAYDRAVRSAAKFGMPRAVSELAGAEIEKSEWAGEVSKPTQRIRVMEAIRATLNEEHFLFWMAHYKSYGKHALHGANAGREL